MKSAVSHDFSRFLEVCVVLVRAPHGGCLTSQPLYRPPHPSQTLANAIVDFQGSLRGPQGIRESPGIIWKALDDHRVNYLGFTIFVYFYKKSRIFGSYVLSLLTRTHVSSAPSED